MGGPVVDNSEIVRKSSKSSSVVKSWKFDVTSNEINKEEVFEARSIDEITDTKENIMDNSAISKTINQFDGNYLNSTGVQLAITETFQKLKQCHSSRADPQTGDQDQRGMIESWKKIFQMGFMQLEFDQEELNDEIMK